jgi:hypothetical protein
MRFSALAFPGTQKINEFIKLKLLTLDADGSGKSEEVRSQF